MSAVQCIYNTIMQLQPQAWMEHKASSQNKRLKLVLSKLQFGCVPLLTRWSAVTGTFCQTQLKLIQSWVGLIFLKPQTTKPQTKTTTHTFFQLLHNKIGPYLTIVNTESRKVPLLVSSCLQKYFLVECGKFEINYLFI